MLVLFFRLLAWLIVWLLWLMWVFMNMWGMEESFMFGVIVMVLVSFIVVGRWVVLSCVIVSGIGGFCLVWV